MKTDKLVLKKDYKLTSKEPKTKAGPNDEENRTPVKNLAIAFGLAVVILGLGYVGMKFLGGA